MRPFSRRFPTGAAPRGALAVLSAFLLGILCLLWCSSATSTADIRQTTRSVSGTMLWQPPVRDTTPTAILRAFVPPSLPWSTAHRGVDLGSLTGRVVAPAAGEVTFVGTVVDRTVLTIRHANGYVSSFEPIDSDLEIGARVTAGQTIGTVAPAPAHCPVRCIHWGVRVPDAWHVGSSTRDLYIDPSFLLGWTEPSILWPVTADPRP